MAEQHQQQVLPQNFEKHETNIMPPTDDQARWMFEYRTLYWDIKAKLMGGELTQEQTGKDAGKYLIYRRAGFRPFMNDNGVEETMALVNFAISKIQALSIYDEERILVQSKLLNIELAIYYFIHYREFDLSLDRASLVIELIMNNFESNLRKSIQGQGLKVIGGTERVVTTQIDNEKKKKFGLF